MSACHTKPFVAPGVLIPLAPSSSASVDASERRETQVFDATTASASCDYCGSADLAWRKCKLICGNCHQINKSCADL